MNEREFIQSILEASSEIALQNFGKVSGTTKEGDSNQVLTETDIAVGNLLVDAVQKTFPKDNIIDEEAGVIDKHANRTWVIDPIDGTSNFANGLPHYGIMIGLLENNEPVAGGVVLPAYGEIYIAEKGKGATVQNQPIAVSTKEQLSDCLIAYGIDGHREDPEKTITETKQLASLILSIRNLRTSNSAFDMMMAARGRYDGYMNKTTKVWDNVAPQIIITEAGGKYTDYNGSSIDYTSAIQEPEKNYTVIAASPLLHKQIMKSIYS